ncbi:MAG: hypothetical protein HYV96_14225 [Opitutae bacterium]|nr:hypothetical protein [Opitutae bacterium]
MDDSPASFPRPTAVVPPPRQVFVTVSAASLAQLEQRLSEMGRSGYVQIGCVVSSRSIPAVEKYFCLMSFLAH